MRSQEQIIAELIADLPPMSEEQEAVENLRLEVSRLEGLLDYYRGDCDDCGRVNVLLAHWEPDEDRCLLDQDECERLHAERLEAKRQAMILERQARRERIAKGTASMADRVTQTLEDTYEPMFRDLRDNRHHRLQDLLYNGTPVYPQFATSNVTKEKE